MTKPRQGPLMPGEPVQLTDPKGRSHLITLRAGASFHTHRGTLSHDDIIGGPDGNVVRSLGGTPYVVFRPLLADFTLAMKRGAAALSCWLLRAVGEQGSLVSFERMPVFAEIARRNVEQFFGGAPPSWQLVTGEFSPEGLADFDRVVLDMLAPWDLVDEVASVLAPGGLACCYVATTTQLSRTVEALRGHGAFDEPAAWESLTRPWHVEGLAVRPGHRMVGHTGFLVTARRLAPGVVPPPRRRRPAKGAQEEDHSSERTCGLGPVIRDDAPRYCCDGLMIILCSETASKRRHRGRE